MTIDHLFTVDPWPHQREGVKQAIAALENGAKSLCLTSPTGSGKSHMIFAMLRYALSHGKRAVLFTNRILLTQQMMRELDKTGIDHGVISASMPQYEYEHRPVQLATIQTILSRRRSDENYWVDADLVIADEVHQVASGDSAELLNEYKERGAKGCHITATPLGVAGVCDQLIVAAGTRQLQKDGRLCYARWHAPSELDTRKLVKGKVDLSLTERQAASTWGRTDQVRTKIVGNILEHYAGLHPQQTHTLFFAPDVRSSLWFAQFCHGRGIRALHVDGTDFWVDGEMHDRKSEQSRFEDAMDEWRDGYIPVITNRFVLREGIDEPLIKCVILGTPVGSYRSFLQMVGRGLRTHDTKEVCIVVDHGGNWWRHGSVNVDVDWHDVFHCSDPDVLSKNRIAEMRETGESAGVGCPNCGMVHKGKKRMIYCQYCNHKFDLGKASRPIMQADGKLVQVNGEPVKQWKIKATPENERIWNGLYYNALRKNKDVTFNQLYQQFAYKMAVEKGSRTRPAFWKAHHPPRDMPLMPVNKNDWHAKVQDVRKESLI